MTSKNLPVLIMLLLALAFTGCQKSEPGDGANLPPYYNLDVKLYPENSETHHAKGSGAIKFRQDPDTARIITLDTWVNGLAPNHPYLLQRAVNPITDSSCSSTAWLTLGLGLAPKSIRTDAYGSGHEELFRNITALARGTEFRIHFQIVDSITLVPVLSSDCYQYTVR